MLSDVNCCNECGFVAKSELGVRIHKGRAHKVELELQDVDAIQSNITQSLSYQVCSLILENEDSLNDHIKKVMKSNQQQKSNNQNPVPHVN